MGRYLSWIANTVLFVLCCFFVASTVNTVFASLLAPEPVVTAAAPAPPATLARSWHDREVILKRNLFNASLLSPAPPPLAETEALEASQLPLSLLGTVAAADPAHSWAAVADLEARKTLVLKNGDPVSRGATVLRIDRRRIVLLENGAARELALDEDESNGASKRPQPRPRRARRTALSPRDRAPGTNRNIAERVREIARNRYQVPRDNVEEAVRNPASILSQAQIQPKYEDGEMVGMQVNAIRPGSIFEEIGMQSGDLITEVNGIPIDSPEASAAILTEFSEADEIVITGEGEEGTYTKSFVPEE